MDLEVVEKEVASWAPEEQDRLAAFLTVDPALGRSQSHQLGELGRSQAASRTPRMKLS